MNDTASGTHDTAAKPQWVVDSDFEVLKAQAFDEKYSTYIVNGKRIPSPGLGAALRLERAHFDTEGLALAHAVKLLDASIAASEAQTATLRERRRELAGA
jgi:hypothetical protein